jgi:hypothetical protein
MVFGKVRITTDHSVGAKYMAEEIAKLDPFQRVCPRCRAAMSKNEDNLLNRCYTCRTLSRGIPVVMRELPIVALPELGQQ